MTAFFVPHVPSAEQEDAYGALAALVGGSALPPDQRISSITWRHDGVEWTATVGETLHGIESVTKGRGRDKRHLAVPRSTSDTVLAIFSGVPFMIAHDNRSRVWNVPIYAGNPSRIVRFSQSQP